MPASLSVSYIVVYNRNQLLYFNSNQQERAEEEKKRELAKEGKTGNKTHSDVWFINLLTLSSGKCAIVNLQTKKCTAITIPKRKCQLCFLI